MSVGKKSKLLSGAKIGLGMAAWATSMMAIFIPLLSDYGIWMALLLAAVHGMLEALKSYPQVKKALVILPDSIRNYLTKFVSDDWMREQGFM